MGTQRNQSIRVELPVNAEGDEGLAAVCECCRLVEARRVVLEEENRRLREALHQFVYRVSHDLQAPLRHVRAFSELLKKRYDEVLDDDGREFLEFAHAGAVRAQALLDALLGYSRVLTPNKPFEPVDCGALLRTVLDAIGVELRACGATVECGALPTVTADAGQLTEVLRHLLSNALRFHKPGEAPLIAVSATLSGEEWVFAVQDHGIGIEPEDRERVFEVFHRVASEPGSEGLGMGLPLSRRIVERHGGRLWVESQPGLGSTFFFSLPRGGG